MAKNKYYAIAKGHKMGIVDNWSECESSIKGFSGAIYKGFPTKPEAEAWLKSQTGDGPVVMGEKIYCVAKGRIPGIYYSWPKCQDQIQGFSGALYKSFPNTDEGHVIAAQFLSEHINIDDFDENPQGIPTSSSTVEDQDLLKAKNAYKIYLKSLESSKESNHVVVYVDGSFGIIKDSSGKVKEKVYSGGIVVIKDGNIIHRFADKGHDQELAQQQNVAGEMVSAIRAIEYVTSKMPTMTQVTIVYDYEGIEHWATGAWKRKNPYTEKYHKYMQTKMKSIKMNFIHCDGHSVDYDLPETGNIFNEEADHLAGYIKDCYKAGKEFDINDFMKNHSYINVKVPVKMLKQNNVQMFSELKQALSNEDTFSKFKEYHNLKNKTFEGIYKSCLKDTEDKFSVQGEEAKKTTLLRLKEMLKEAI